MKLKTYSILIMLMIVLNFDLPAAVTDKGQPVLNDKTISRFINDFPALHRDLAAYSRVEVQAFEAFMQEGSAIQDIDAVRSDLETAMKNQGVRRIVEKHGWGSSYSEVYITIFTAYSISIAEDLFKASPDPSLTVYIARWKPALHPDDLEIVRKNRSKLEEVFLSIGQE